MSQKRRSPYLMITLASLLAMGTVLVGYYWQRNLVTVIVDPTPPAWLLDSANNPLLMPVGNATYSSINTIQASVADPESGVTSVQATLDSVTPYNLTLLSGNDKSGTWQATITPPAMGNHTVQYVATNGVKPVGLTSVYVGTFRVYTALQGTWSINDQLITSSSQTVYASNSTVWFAFQKTSGPDDSQVTTYVYEGSNLLKSVVGLGPAVYPTLLPGQVVYSITLALGTHNLTLKASDGTTLVTMSIIGLSVQNRTMNISDVWWQALMQQDLLRALLFLTIPLTICLLFLYMWKRKRRN